MGMLPGKPPGSGVTRRIINRSMFLAVPLAGFLATSAPLQYRVIDLGPPHRERVTVRSVNVHAWVTTTRQWVWRPGTGWFELPTYPGYRRTEARAVNNNGEIACVLEQVGPHEAGVWSEKVGVRKIEMPPGLDFQATSAINDHGEIVGYAYDKEERLHGWLYIPGRPTIDLGQSPDGVGAQPMAINDQGVIATFHVGSDSLGGMHFWFRDGGYQYIGHPSGYEYFPRALNETRVVVGSGGVIGSYQVWSPPETWSRLESLPDFTTGAAWDCNDSHWIVGTGVNLGQQCAFLWRPDVGTVMLKQIVDSTLGDWRLEYARAISNNGYIAGTGYRPGDQSPRCFLAVPRPVPNSGGGGED